NAIKFTDRGEVVVEVTRAEEPHAKAPSRKEEEVEQEGIAPAPSSLGGLASLREVFVHFTVRDTGMGIPADKRDGLFTPFVQVDGSLTRRHGGTGLGLAISRRLAEIMGGTIWFESPAPAYDRVTRWQGDKVTRDAPATPSAGGPGAPAREDAAGQDPVTLSP